MAAPTIDAIYPNNNATGIPVGASIQVTFDQGIDLSSGKSNVVLYGADFDQTSGPDGALWLGPEGTRPNDEFLRSPSHTGIVKCDASVVYVDSNGDTLDPQPTVYDRDEEVAGSYRHKLLITPKEILGEEVEHKASIIGASSGGVSRGISKRTVYDVDHSGASSTAATIAIYGGYTGTVDDTLHVKITKAGDVGVAQYKWWYERDGEAQATIGKMVSRRYRRLEDGIQVRFTGSGYVVGDEFTVAIYAPEYLAQTYSLTFTTGTGSIIDVPDAASTSVIGTTSSASPTGYLTVVDSDPENGATHQPLTTRTMEIVFSNTLDGDTVDDDSVAVFAYPVSGRFGDNETEELAKKLTVSGDTLTIEI